MHPLLLFYNLLCPCALWSFVCVSSRKVFRQYVCIFCLVRTCQNRVFLRRRVLHFLSDFCVPHHSRNTSNKVVSAFFHRTYKMKLQSFYFALKCLFCRSILRTHCRAFRQTEGFVLLRYVLTYALRRLQA